MEVSQSYEAKIGDRLDFHYSISGFGKQGQIESLVTDLDKDPRWKVEQYEFNEGLSKVRIRVKVIKNPLPVILIVAAIGAIGAGLFCWLSLDKIEAIIADPVGGLSILGVVIGIVLFLRGKYK